MGRKGDWLGEGIKTCYTSVNVLTKWWRAVNRLEINVTGTTVAQMYALDMIANSVLLYGLRTTMGLYGQWIFKQRVHEYALMLRKSLSELWSVLRYQLVHSPLLYPYYAWGISTEVTFSLFSPFCSPHLSTVKLKPLHVSPFFYNFLLYI